MKKFAGIIEFAVVIAVLVFISIGVYDDIGDTVYEGNMTGLTVGITYATTASGDADFEKANKVIKPEKNTVDTKYYDSFKDYWGKNYWGYITDKDNPDALASGQRK